MFQTLDHRSVPGAERQIRSADLPAILDAGDACDVLAARSPDAHPLVEKLLASACDLREGRLARAATLAHDLARTLDISGERDEPLFDAALAHLGRVGIVLGDPVLLAEHRRLVGSAGLPADSRSPLASANPPPEQSDDAWTRRAAITPSDPPSYRRGAFNARLAATLVARGEAELALAAAEAALADLARTASPREVAIATLASADALALLGRHGEAAERCRPAERVAATDPTVARALVEHHAWFGDGSAARRYETEGAGVDEMLLDAGLDPAAILRATARSATIAVATGSDEAPALARSLGVLASRLGAALWVDVGRTLEALTGDLPQFDLGDGGGFLPPSTSLGMVAPAIVAHLDRLDPASGAVIREAATTHAVRWRPLLRAALRGGAGSGGAARRLAAARLLAAIGELADVPLLDEALRNLGARGEDADLPKSLARRVAPRLEVSDLGRVSVGLAGSPLAPIGRRKVLALLCFLLTQPEFAATREQVLDALWPDQDPDTAANSLNQTIYFLRRTIEASYRDRTSPEYVHHEAEVVWLDPALVNASSRRCTQLVTRVRRVGDDAQDAIDELAETYSGRFALDFSYDPWAETFREGLHASYLASMEAGIAHALEAGDLTRGIRLAERTLTIDPSAEGIELGLLRLYRRAGAYAAAAERYAHYASVMRDELGVEPPSLDSL